MATAASLTESYARGKPIPADILYMIAREYFEDHSANGNCFQLLTVSKMFLRLGAPRLYHTVIPRSASQARTIIMAIQGQLKYCKPALHIRRLWLHDMMDCQPELSQMLLAMRECRNLRHVAYGPARRNSTKDYDIGDETPVHSHTISRLSLITMPFQRDTNTTNVKTIIGSLHIPLSNLTHLHFLVPMQPVFEFLFHHTSELSSLTHISLDLSFDDPLRPAPQIQSTLFVIAPKMALLRGLFGRISTLKEILITSIHPLTDLEVVSSRGSSLFPGAPEIKIVTSRGPGEGKDGTLKEQPAQQCKDLGIMPRLVNISYLWNKVHTDSED